MTLSIGQTAAAEPYSLTASGWDGPTGVDQNSDGAPLWDGTVFGQGKFGKSVTHITRDRIFVGFEMGCGGLPADVFALKLQIVAHSVVTRYENGDMLFATLDTSTSDNFVCVGISSPGNWYGSKMIIHGGTGRFEGATGWYDMSATVTGMPRPTGEFSQNAVQLKAIGEVFLAE
jgi:hypothetical protein